jgi:transposase InsO family protein
MSYSLNQLYKTVGISKQAVYQYQRRQQVFDAKMFQLTIEADELRKEHPGCGVEKMYYTLCPDFIGRDRFTETMMQLGYRLKRKKNYKRTTIASKLYYPNLIKGLSVSKPSTIWQSDITYIPLNNRHYYAVFIIDVYSKKIVGYSITDHMRATANVAALKMALKDHKPPDIHHSDRGSQYTYKAYIDLLEQNKVKISMALSAQDNAYAERINRTIKEEYLNHWKPQSFAQLKRMIKKAVNNYNSKRIHNNLVRMTPKQFEKTFSLSSRGQRKTITIFNNEILT